MNPLLFVSIFFRTVCIVGLYAFYTIEITKKNALKSALSGSFIHILTAFTVISYTENYLYLIPLVMGSFVGTYLIVFYTKNN